MSARLKNRSEAEDSQEGWKTYYIQITIDGRVHYKFGVCNGSLRKRFSKEPSTTTIEIIRLWNHESDILAYRHEEQLFREYQGDRPYIGECGPLKNGGNTETYSHDVLAGEPPPHRYTVRLLSTNDLTLYTYGYSGKNPKEPYRHLYGLVKYMDYSFGPEGMYLQVPHLSHQDTVTLATSEYLFSEVERYEKKRAHFMAQKFFDAIGFSLYVNAWTDHSRMRFESLSPFYVEQYANWV